MAGPFISTLGKPPEAIRERAKRRSRLRETTSLRDVAARQEFRMISG